jgi:hypothetical protein
MIIGSILGVMVPQKSEKGTDLKTAGVWNTPHHFIDSFDAYANLNDARNYWHDDLIGTNWQLINVAGDKHIQITSGGIELKKLNPGKSDLQIKTDIWLEGNGRAGIVFYGSGWMFPFATWVNAYGFFFSTQIGLPCQFMYKENGGWTPIGRYPGVGIHFLLNTRYEVKIVVSGHQFYGYVRIDGGGEDDWGLVAWVSNFEGLSKSNLITPDISYEPYSTPIIENQVGLMAYQGSINCHFDDFDVRYNTIYDTFDAPLGGGPGQDNNWVIGPGYAEWHEIDHSMSIHSNSQVTFPMGDLGWHDFVIELDISTNHNPPPPGDVWFIIQFRQEFYLKIKLDPINQPDGSFYWNGINPGDKIGKTREVTLLNEWNHLQIVVMDSVFLANINQAILCSAQGPTPNNNPQFGDIKIMTTGNPANHDIYVDNFYISLKAIGDDFQGPAPNNPPDSNRWACLDGLPLVKNIDLFASQALALENGGVSSRVLMRNNFISYSGYSIEFDCFGVKPGPSTSTILGYIGIGYSNGNSYVLCLDMAGGPKYDSGNRLYYDSGIRFLTVHNNDWEAPSSFSTSVLLGIAMPERNQCHNDPGHTDADAVVHIRIQVSEERLFAYMKRMTGNEPHEVLVATTDRIPFTMGEGMESAPFGDIVIYNDHQNSIYVDNIHCSLDTDLDGSRDLMEIWGKSTISDIGTFENNVGAIYRFYIHKYGSETVAPFKLVFRARFPAYGEILPNWLDFKIYAEVLDDSDQWNLVINGDTFFGRGYWQTYVSEALYQFNGGNPSGKELFVRIHFDNLDTNAIELDWIGLTYFEESVRKESADIADVDDFARCTGGTVQYFGRGLGSTLFSTYYIQDSDISKETLVQRGEWEYFDFDGDALGDRLESRVYMRSTIPYALYCDDFYDEGKRVIEYQGQADKIYYRGREYRYDDVAQAPIDEGHAGFLLGDRLFDLSDGASIYYYVQEDESGQQIFETITIRSENFQNVAGDKIWMYFCGGGGCVNGFDQPEEPFWTEPLSVYQDGREIIGLMTPEITNERFALLYAGGDGRDFWGNRYIQETTKPASQNWLGGPNQIAYGYDTQFAWDVLATRNALDYQEGFIDDNKINDFDGRNDHIATIWKWRTGWPQDVVTYKGTSYCVGLDDHKINVGYKDAGGVWQSKTHTSFDNAVTICAVNLHPNSNFRYAVASLDGLIKIIPKGDLAQWENNIVEFHINKRITGLSWQPNPSKPDCLVYSYLDYEYSKTNYYDPEYRYVSYIGLIYWDTNSNTWVQGSSLFFSYEPTGYNDDNCHFMIQDIVWPNSYLVTDYLDKIFFGYYTLNNGNYPTYNIGMIKWHYDLTGHYYYLEKFSTINTLFNDQKKHGQFKMISPLNNQASNTGKSMQLVVLFQDFIGEHETPFTTEIYILQLGTSCTLSFWLNGANKVKIAPNDFILDFAVKPNSGAQKIVTTDVKCKIITYTYNSGTKIFSSINTMNLLNNDMTPYCIDYYDDDIVDEEIVVGLGNRDWENNQAYTGHVWKYKWTASGNWQNSLTRTAESNDYYNPDGNPIPQGAVDYIGVMDKYNTDIVNYLKLAILKLREVMDGNDILFSCIEDHGIYDNGFSYIYTGSVAGPYWIKIQSQFIKDYFYSSTNPDNGMPIVEPALRSLYEVHTFSACKAGDFGERFYGYNHISLTSTYSEYSTPIDNCKTTLGDLINERDSATSRSGNTLDHYHTEFGYYLVGVLNRNTLKDNDIYVSRYVLADYDGDGYISMTETYNYLFAHNSRTQKASDDPYEDTNERARFNDNNDDVTTEGFEWTLLHEGPPPVWTKELQKLPTVSWNGDGFIGLFGFI